VIPRIAAIPAMTRPFQEQCFENRFPHRHFDTGSVPNWHSPRVRWLPCTSAACQYRSSASSCLAGFLQIEYQPYHHFPSALFELAPGLLLHPFQPAWPTQLQRLAGDVYTAVIDGIAPFDFLDNLPQVFDLAGTRVFFPTEPPAPKMYLSILVLYRADVEQSWRQINISSADEAMAFNGFFGAGVMRRLRTDWLELECRSVFPGRINCDRLLTFRGA
jgi:hypothetical protein